MISLIQEYKKWLILAVVSVVCVFGVVIINNHINNEISTRTQKIEEAFIKQLADTKLKCEADSINQEKQYKQQIVELQNEIEKTKILLEKIQKQKTITESIKKDVKSFVKKFDLMLGTKGKINEK